MGGTSFDVAISLDGRPAEAATTMLEFRLPVRVPMLDVRTIGAGGGSIASIDRGGILQVGPRSAGSYPGPVAFGRGGTEPTVTDANVVLGRIDPDHPIGADGGRLDIDGARTALAELGAPLGLDAEAAARAVLAVVNTRMAGEIRLITVEQGHDPREFAFVAFGGAGPVHGAALMREMQLGTMLVPPSPGVLCAMGCVVADVRHDVSRTIERTLPRRGAPSDGRLDVAALQRVLAEQRAEGEHQLSLDGLEFAAVDVDHFADMSYVGQIHRLRVAVGAGDDADRLRERFVAQYRAEYGTELGELDVVVVNARTVVSGRRAATAGAPRPPATAAPEPRAHRRVCFQTWVEAPVYAREDLLPGSELAGPMIVEQVDTTVVIEPDMDVTVDLASNLIVRRR